jgi:hypothetical protein
VLAVDESVFAVEDGVVELSLDAIEPEALPDAAALPLNEPEAELGELVVSLEPLVLLLVLGSLLATRDESVLVAELSLELALLLLSLLAIFESDEVRPVGERLSPEDVEPEADVEESLEELGVWLASVSELALEPELVLAVVSAEDVLLESVVPAVLRERSVSEVDPVALMEPLEDGVELVELVELGLLEAELLLILLFVVLLFAIDVFCVELLDGWEEVVPALPEAVVVPLNPNEPDAVEVFAEFAVSVLATFALLVLLVVFDVLMVASVDVERVVSLVTTTGDVAVVVEAVVPYSVEEDRVAELQPASARPAKQRMKIVLFIGDFELPND